MMIKRLCKKWIRILIKANKQIIINNFFKEITGFITVVIKLNVLKFKKNIFYKTLLIQCNKDILVKSKENK